MDPGHGGPRAVCCRGPQHQLSQLDTNQLTHTDTKQWCYPLDLLADVGVPLKDFPNAHRKMCTITRVQGGMGVGALVNGQHYLLCYTRMKQRTNSKSTYTSIQDFIMIGKG